MDRNKGRELDGDSKINIEQLLDIDIFAMRVKEWFQMEVIYCRIQGQDVKIIPSRLREVNIDWWSIKSEFKNYLMWDNDTINMHVLTYIPKLFINRVNLAIWAP